MIKIVWSKERYQEEYKNYLKEQGAPSATSMIDAYNQWIKYVPQFETDLRGRGIFWETCSSLEYRALRDTPIVKRFLETQDIQLTQAEFTLLAEKAVKQAFGDLSYLDEGWPKMLKSTLKSKSEVLKHVLRDRGIVILKTVKANASFSWE